MCETRNAASCCSTRAFLLQLLLAVVGKFICEEPNEKTLADLTIDERVCLTQVRA